MGQMLVDVVVLATVAFICMGGMVWLAHNDQLASNARIEAAHQATHAEIVANQQAAMMRIAEGYHADTDEICARRAALDKKYHASVESAQDDVQPGAAQSDADSHDPDARNVQKLIDQALREVAAVRAASGNSDCINSLSTNDRLAMLTNKASREAAAYRPSAPNNKPVTVVKTIQSTIEFTGIINTGTLDMHVQSGIAAYVPGVTVNTRRMNYIGNVLTITMDLTIQPYAECDTANAS